LLQNNLGIAAVLAGLLALATLKAAAQLSQDPPSSGSTNQQQPAKPEAGTPQPETKPSPATTDQTTPAQVSPTQTGDTKAKPDGTSNDRLFYALPNFLTLRTREQVPPLTTKQKYSVIVRSSFDPVQLPWYGFLSAISQAENSEGGYGQGWAGFGKRFGAYAADGTIENFMVGAILPAALHQDPRFFQSGEGSFGHRAFYSMSRIVVTRGDSGKSEFNYSEIVGAALASAISTYSYHPRSYITYHYDSMGTKTAVFNPSDRTLKNTASVFASQVGYDALTFVVKEFWPDIQRKISKKHSQAAAN
jgi:hypothetical protein